MVNRWRPSRPLRWIEMSVENIVICSRARMPDPGEWQAAIAAAGFELRLASRFDPLAFSGRLACHDGKASCGFEYFCDNLDQEWLQDLKVKLPPGYDCVVCLATQSSYDDAMASAIAAAALAMLTSGVLLEGGEAPLIPAAAALAWAQRTVSELTQLRRRDEEAEALAGELGRDRERAERVFSQALESLSGQRIEELITLQGSPVLGVRFANGVMVRGRRWQLDTPDAGSIAAPDSGQRTLAKDNGALAAAKYLAQRLTAVPIRYAELSGEQSLTLWFENGARLRMPPGDALQAWELRTTQLCFEFVDRELQISAA
jgi:hypothetical protein